MSESPLKPITLRNLPPEVARAVRRRAREKRISLNRAVAELLAESARLPAGNGRRRTYDDLDWMFGSWSKRESARFARALARERRVEPELWK